MIKYTELSKVVSHALRHQPDLYGLQLDQEGWVDIMAVVNSLKNKQKYHSIEERDIYTMVEKASKKRHEIKNGQIKALYGHSLENSIKYFEAEPPSILYHGTSRGAMALISLEGIKPMDRLYVHLSSDKNMAYTTGLRKDNVPLVLIVNALQAFNDGVKFYFANDNVWLSNCIPSKYINKLSGNEAQKSR